MQAKAPIWLLLPHLQEYRGPQERHLCQVCGQIHGYCPWPIEGCHLGSSGPVNGRSPMTETVLQLKDRHHGSEAWWSCLSEGWHLSGKEEDSRQVGGQASWGGASDHDRHPLIQSDGPMWTVMHPTLQPTSPHHIRNWCSPVCGCLPSIPALPQLSLLPKWVTARLCHEKIVVWQSPSIRPGRHPWGWLMGSYYFCQRVHWGWVRTSGNE